MKPKESTHPPRLQWRTMRCSSLLARASSQWYIGLNAKGPKSSLVRKAVVTTTNASRLTGMQVDPLMLRVLPVMIPCDSGPQEDFD